jgi:hypothetical protein
MSLQDKFVTFIKYTIIELVTNSSISMRDYCSDDERPQSALYDALKHNNNNFELAISSVAKNLSENQKIINYLKLLFPSKYQDIKVEEVGECEEAEDKDKDECEEGECEEGESEEDECDDDMYESKSDLFHIVIESAGLHQMFNAHADNCDNFQYMLFEIMKK